MRRSAAASLSAFLAALMTLAAPPAALAQAGSSSVEVVPPDAPPGTAASPSGPIHSQAAEPLVPPPPPLPPPPPPPVTTTTTSTSTATVPAGTAVDAGESVTVITSERIEVGPQAAPGTAGLKVGDKETVRLTSTPQGPIGLYAVEAADIGQVGVLRFSLLGTFFDQSDFPELGPHDQRSQAFLSLAYAPWWPIEIYAGSDISANVSTGTNSTNPNFISALGDFWGGVKVGSKVIGGLSLAADLRGAAYAAGGTSGYGAGAFIPTAIVTYDALKVSRIPVRLHFNGGGLFGNLSNLGLTSSAGQPIEMRAPEQFARGYSAYNQFRLGLAVEAPLPYVTPFAEYALIYPLGTPPACNPGMVSSATLPCLHGPDAVGVSLSSALPQVANFGARVTALPDVSFLIGVTAGLQSQVALTVPIVPKWELFFGVSYNLDPTARNTTHYIEKTRTVTKAVAAPEPTGQITGTVVDAETHQAIGGALISFGTLDLPPVGTDSGAGRFRSYPLGAGPIELSASREGYQPSSARVLVVVGQTTNIEIPLQRAVKTSVVKIAVHDASGKPLAASVTLDGPGGAHEETAVPAQGEVSVTLPVAGSYAARITATGYLAKLAKFEVVANQPQSVSFTMEAAPKKTVLIITDKKIRLKKQIHFGSNDAKIFPDSDPILNEVVDAIISHHIERLRIEGHTDNQGNKAHNLQLSQQRADAVMQYLIAAGIPADHLEAVGYGDTRPIAPNLTSRGRALNRRVEFDIL